jgi:hypothetical protein
MVFRIASHVAWQRLEDEAVVIDVPARTAIGLNPSGTVVWDLIEDHDLQEIAEKLADHFQIPSRRAVRDVTKLVEELKSRRLIEEVT